MQISYDNLNSAEDRDSITREAFESLVECARQNTSE